MEELIGECLGILGRYNDTINATRAGWAFVATDQACDSETRSMSENLVIAVLLDKSAALLPDGDDEQKAILDATEGLNDVICALPEITPLILTAILGYAIALSQSHWGWIPWQNVRNAILDHKEEQN